MSELVLKLWRFFVYGHAAPDPGVGVWLGADLRTDSAMVLRYAFCLRLHLLFWNLEFGVLLGRLW